MRGTKTVKIGNKTETSEYVYANGQLAYEKRGDSELYFFYDGLGHLAAIRYYEDAASDTYTQCYVATNMAGDVLNLIDGNGNIIAKYAYDAWGNVISVKDGDSNDITDEEHIALVNPILYRGYYYDKETKFYYLQSRYYDPAIGRFINADAIISGVGGIVLGNNMFAYCLNNPVMFLDATGLAPEWWQWALSGTMFVVGIVFIATGFGGAIGGSLICAGANSIINSYVVESNGGSSVAGWVGGMITGTFCGLGAGYAGGFFVDAANTAGMACLSNLSSGLAISFSTGFSGSVFGQIATASIDDQKISTKDLLFSSTVAGSINCIAGFGAATANGISTMPSISSTSSGLATAISTVCSVVTEAICDFFSVVTSWMF